MQLYIYLRTYTVYIKRERELVRHFSDPKKFCVFFSKKKDYWSHVWPLGELTDQSVVVNARDIQSLFQPNFFIRKIK
jgi:hypothetical protein